MKLTREQENKIVDAIMDNLNENKVHLVFNDEVIYEEDNDEYFELDVKYKIYIDSYVEDDTDGEVIKNVEVYVKEITSDFSFAIDADYDYIENEVESRIW